MNIIKKLPLLLLLFLSIVINNYSQSFIRNRNTNYINDIKSPNMLINKDLESNYSNFSNPNGIHQIIRFPNDQNIIIDSVIQFNQDLAKKTDIYNYDSLGNIVEHKYKNVYGAQLRTLFSYDRNKNLITQVSQYSNNSQWMNDNSYTYEYDSLNNQISSLWQRWTDGILSFQKKIIYQYSVSNLLLSWTSKVWSGTWNDHEKAHYEYDANKNLIEMSEEYFSFNEWINTIKINYEYDDKNRIIETASYEWGSFWKNQSRYTFLYDNDKLISKQIESGINSLWFPEKQILYGYNSSNNKISEIYQNWSWSDSQYVNLNQHIFEYDANNRMTMDFMQIWKDSVWSNYAILIYKFSSEGELVEEKYDEWSDEMWINYYRYTYNYLNGLCSDAICERLENINWEPFLGSLKFKDYEDRLFVFDAYKIQVYSSSLTGIKENNTENNFYLFQNYPNPFNPSTTIKYSIPNSTHVAIKVYNMLGEEVTTLVDEFQTKGIHKINFNFFNYTSGVYFYQIRSENYCSSKKMILLK